MAASSKGLPIATLYQQQQRRSTSSVLFSNLLIAFTAIVVWNSASFLLLDILNPGVISGPLFGEGQGRVSGREFDWDETPALTNLTFTPCYNEIDATFQCARLEVPLDHWNGTFPDKKVGLALVRLPAKVPITDPRYGGPILINPGGPGGSGVGLALRDSRVMQIIADSPHDLIEDLEKSDSTKYFDIIGFDPRGIGHTTPGAHCFEAKAVRESWNLRLTAQGNPDSSDAAAGRLWAMAQAAGASCKETSEGDSDIKYYSTTASVAKDMLEIIEAFAEWRAAEAKRILASSQWKSALDVPREQRLLDTLQYKPGKAKLQFWGFSYGSYLGYTFASMFPDRVGRVVVDGIVDSDDYVRTAWTDNLRDTEKVMSEFYNNCALGGAGHCPLAKEGYTPSDVQTRVEAILAKLYHHPFTVRGSSPEIVTYSDVKQWIFRSLYTPYWDFYPLARLLLAIEEGDSTPFASILKPEHTFSCLASNSSKSQLAPIDGEASPAIACSDGDEITDMTAEEYDTFWRKLDGMSPTIGAIWSKIPLTCTGWKFRALHRFTGTFGGETSHPLLFIGNTADPVTPLSSAKKMSALFKGAGLITQDSAGHCSASAWSACTYGHISSYFTTGALPPKGTICSTGRSLFNAPLSTDAIARLEAYDAYEEKAVGAEAKRRKMEAQKHLSYSFAKSVSEWGFGIGGMGISETFWQGA